MFVVCVPKIDWIEFDGVVEMYAHMKIEKERELTHGTRELRKYYQTAIDSCGWCHVFSCHAAKKFFRLLNCATVVAAGLLLCT